MKIQVITNNKEKHFSDAIDVNSLNAPMSFDNYDLNIIDLTCEELWRYSKNHLESINDIDDFVSVGKIVENSQKAKTLYVFPKNTKLHWNYAISHKAYQSHDELKNQIVFFTQSVLPYIIPFHNCSFYQVTYERNITEVNSRNYSSDFFFSSLYISTDKNIITKSSSNKTTTIALTDRLVLTTCDILQSEEDMMSFVNCTLISSSNDEMPSWVNEFDFYNDKELRARLEQESIIVKEAEKRIDSINHEIGTNTEYKSILYSSGNQLVNTVFAILQTMLNVDLSTFQDIYKEDFVIEIGDYVFIGEIKGVSTNVTFNHIAQAIRHFSTYADEHPNIEINKIKPILIVNPLRTIPIDKREPINKNQIDFSEHNRCLIIETVVLLKLFEKCLNNELSVDDCVKILFNTNGILKL